MRKVNLLPYREKEENRHIILHFLFVISITLMTVSVCFLVSVIKSNSLTTYNAQLESLRDTNKEIKKKIGKVKNLNTLKSNVEHKLALVDKLQANRFQVFVHLSELAESLPAKVWVTAIKEQKGGWSLSGYGYSNDSVADFMRMIDRSPLFEDVLLSGVNRVDIKGVQARQFNISVKNSIITPESTEKGAR